uniref:inositol-tetrakisphosphate 1-kinase 1-like n=1 Tax=Erigeron canadensis TaxID=72917 RepID=UPI001CB94AEC|nr:inositol-tetrakisphosphate 1-kinase 1-like [Erigeron canadensis]
MPEIVEENDLFRVGYALPTRKIDAFMVEPFISYARERGIVFIPVDVSKSLTNQGPYDCIIHKLYGAEWEHNLEKFAANNPNATIIDPPSAIQRLHNRLTKGLELDPPMVLQQFVDHGGIMFKVYVAGDYVKCVKRSSLPDLSNETMEKMVLDSGGVMSFSKISSAVIDDGSNENIEMPPPEFLDEVAKGLRTALGLHLFNFDMIRDNKKDGYLVVDINYFPGYEKLPCYESIMIDFFLNIKKSQA